MREPTCGYIESAYCYPNKADWQEYGKYCRSRGLPTILVACPQYWKVEIRADTMPRGRFSPETLDWFRTRVHRFPRVHRYPIASPARVVVYGLDHATATAFAAEVIARFPALTGYTCDPPGTRPRPVASQATTPPRPSWKDRVRGNAPRKVIDLATERRKRRPPWGDPAS